MASSVVLSLPPHVISVSAEFFCNSLYLKAVHIEVLMGIISDIVVAKVSDAGRLCEDINSNDFQFIEMRGLQIDELAALLKVLDPTSVSSNSDAKIQLISAKDKDEGPWAYLLPRTFVERLSEIPDEGIPSVVAGWLEDEGAELIQGAPFDLVEGCLKNLRALSKSAIKEEKALFLRICL